MDKVTYLFEIFKYGLLWIIIALMNSISKQNLHTLKKAGRASINLYIPTKALSLGATSRRLGKLKTVTLLTQSSNNPLG